MSVNREIDEEDRIIDLLLELHDKGREVSDEEDKALDQLLVIQKKRGLTIRFKLRKYFALFRKSFKAHTRKNLRLVSFDDKALYKTVKHSSTTIHGVLTVMIAGAAIGVSQLNPAGILFLPFGLLVMFSVFYITLQFSARYLLGGKASEEQYFRALSNCFIVYWFAFIPFIGVYLDIIASLWLTALNINILHKIHRIHMPAAIALGILPAIMALIIISPLLMT